MKRKEMKKIINKEIKNGNHDRAAIARELLIAGADSLSMVTSTIAKCFKEAGLVSVTKPGAVKEMTAAITDEMVENITTYRELRELAEELMDKYGTSETPTFKAIRDKMKSLGMSVPKKAHLGIIKQLTVDYFMDAFDNGEDTSIAGLAEYLINNVEGGGENATDEMKKKLTITAGTDYTFAYMMFHHLRLEDIN